ncbi:MAG: gliding motility-associated C-terminal domain-containing protein [Bacteroidetes bacterium]|nr:gliding motility-associated C-terminal domain-containing protein [Bacteroidota bacterium]HET6243127.1 gliding motility-associated C-terminal domain-containing protein [Bacteroidia bacterium]
MRIFLLLLFSFLFSKTYAEHKDNGSHSSDKNSRLTFIENKNQWNKNVQYKADIPGGFLYLEKNGFTLDFIDHQTFTNLRGHGHNSKLKSDATIAEAIKAHCIKTSFINSNSIVTLTGIENTQNYYNYFLGNDKAKWAGNVPGYNKILYNDIYNHIDLIVYSTQANLKYDFIVKPGGNPSQILVEYQGADKMQLKNGHLLIKTSVNEFTEQKPYAYQVFNGILKEVPCKYVLNEKQISYFFPLGYDITKELIIDPVLLFSTHSGSYSNNFGYTATFDSKGFLYAASTAFGNLYPVTPGAYDISFNSGNVDIAITKYDTSGTAIIYSTYLGGNGDELPHSLVVNSNQELFIYGTTGSANFPVTSGAYDNTFNGGPALSPNGLGVSFPSGSDIIVSRLNSNGSQLLASTYLGGSHNDGLNYTSNNTVNNILKYNYADEVRGEIDIDEQNNIYIVSCTRSINFPIVGNSFQPVYGGGDIDGVVVKMNNSLSSIIWSSFIGGNQHDAAYSLSLDSNNDIYIAGGTSSPNFPVTSTALQSTFQGGRSDGFILHVSKNGQTIINGTYYGSIAYDQTYFVELDKQNNIYVFGQTEASGNTFIYNALYSNPNSGQFISKITPQLDSLIFSTAFGTGSGGPNISPTAFLVDVCNKMYLSGWGGGTNNLNINFLYNNAGYTTGMQVTPDAFQSTTDGSDFYLMVLEDDASALVYGSFFGGSQSQEHVDGGTSRFDKKGKIYQTVCAGCGGNSDFPIYPNPGAVSPTNNSSCNSAVFKFDFNLPISIAGFDAPAPGCVPYTVQFVNNSTITGTSNYYWEFGDGNTSTDFNPIHEYLTTGLFNIMLVTYDIASCNLSDTVFAQVIVLSDTSYSLTPQTICGSGAVQIGLTPVNDPSITYHWSPATGLSDTAVANPFANPSQTAQYTLIMSNGICMDTISQTVNYYPELLNVTADTSVCGDAALLLVASTMGNYYQYIWSSNSTFTDTLNSPLSDSTLNISIANSTTYYIMALESGCVLKDSVKIQVFPDSTYVLNPLTLCGQGSIQIGLTPLNDTVTTYHWSPGISLTDSTLANPYALLNESAEFQLIILNGACIDTLTQVVNYFPNLLETSLDTFVCSPSSISIYASTFGNFSQYIWSSNSMFSDTLNNPLSDSTLSINVINSSTYYILASESVCNLLDSVSIQVYSDTTYSLSPLEICKGDTVNIGFLTVPGNVYTWNSSFGISDSTISYPQAWPIENSSYMLLSFDGFCTDTIYQSVNVVPVPDIQVTNDTTICRGNEITVFATTGGVYSQYIWSSNPSFSDTLNNSVADSFYTFIPLNDVTLYIGAFQSICVVMDSVKIYVLKDTMYSLPNVNLCFADSVQIGQIPSTDPTITYSWNPSTGLSNSSIPNPFASPGQSLMYELLISNGFCTDTIRQFVNVTSFNLFTVNDTTVCKGQSLQINAGTDIPGSSFHWSSNAGFTDTLNFVSNDGSLFVNPVQGSNMYYVKALLSGCEKQDSVRINNDEVKIQANSSGICFGDTAFLTAINLVSSQELSYSWSPVSMIIAGENTSTALASPSQSTAYSVTAENSSGCKASSLTTLSVSLLEPQTINASVSQDSILAGNSVLLQAMPTSGYTYQWNPHYGLNNSQVSAPVSTPFTTTTYTVTIADGPCYYSDSVTVYVYEIVCGAPNIFIPNAFTPNDDNKNDVLYVRGKYIDLIYFTVYNRWGEKVFETTDQSVGWDGVFKGMKADPGVFVYYLTATCLDGQNFFLKGNVTLIR